MTKKPIVAALAVLTSVALVAGSVDAKRGGRPKPKPRHTTSTIAPTTTATSSTTSATALPAAGDAQIDIAHSGQRLGNHPKHARSFKLQVNETLVASTIGISFDALRTELRTGLSVAQVATSRGVPTSSVTTVITTDMTTQINTALADGKITQARAAQLLTDLPVTVTNYVNRVHYVRPNPTTTTQPTTTTTAPATTTTAATTTTTAG